MNKIRALIAWTATTYIGWFTYAYLISKYVESAYEIWLVASILSALVWAIWFSIGDHYLRKKHLKFTLKNPLLIIISTGIIGLLFPTAFTYASNFNWLWSHYYFNGVLITALCGFVTGIVLGFIFWILKYLKTPNKSSNLIGANNAPPS